MKKGLIFVALLSVFASFGFAQAYDDLNAFQAEKQFEEDKAKTIAIVPEEQHLFDKNGSVKIEYNPAYDEVRIYYETLYVTYDRAEAMNTVLACLLDFQNNMDLHSGKSYYHYKYLKDDKERFFKDDRGQRKAQYISYVKFSR